MVIYIDGSALINNAQGGIGHYTRELIKKLCDTPDFSVTILVFQGDQVDHITDLNAAIEFLPFPRKIYVLLWKLFIPLNVHRFLAHRNPDAIIYPNFGMIPYVRTNTTKTLTIIHDLAFLHFPHTVEIKNRLFLQQAVVHTARQSQHIFFPSNFSLDDFRRHYATSASLHVAYPGYELPIIRDPISPQIREIAKGPFLFFIGTIEPRKNIHALVRAYLQSDFYTDKIPLVIAGKRGWGDTQLPDNPLVIQTDMITNAERHHLYSHCRAFVFPSLFEGFGMPVVEAMYYRKPVIVSRNSSLEEIVNDKIAYCIEAPFDTPAILQQLQRLYDEHPQEVTRRTDAAHVAAQRYTWGASADQYLAVLRAKHDKI